MEKSKSAIGGKLNTLLSLKGISQAEVSERGQVDRSNLNRYLRGRSDIRTDSFVKVLKVLGIDIDSLLNSEIKIELGEGLRTQNQLGKHVENIFRYLDPLVVKTVLETIIAKGRRSSSPEVLASVEKLREYCSNVSTTGRGGGRA